MLEYGLESMFVINDFKKIEKDRRLYCSTLQTIQSRIKSKTFFQFLKTFDFVIIDECHTQFSNFLFETGIFDDIYVVGLTGSPTRNGQMRQMGIDYDKIVLSKTVQEMVDMEFLVPLRYFEHPMDVSEIKTDNLTGDFQGKSAYQKFDTPEKYGGVVKNYKLHGESSEFICFCCNRSHTIKTCVAMNEAGIKTKYVLSNVGVPNKPNVESGAAWERYLDHKETYDLHQKYKHLSLSQDDVNPAFDRGEIKGVCCIEILSTGWDRKSLICCIMNRATKSISLYLQMIGRVQRILKGKKYGIFLDLGSNVKRLGTAELEREWCEWHETSDSIGLPAMKLCGEKGKDIKGNPGCGKIVLASMDICPKCGFHFKTEKELKEIELKERLKDSPSQFSMMNTQQLLAYAELKGYAKQWVFRQIYMSEHLDFDKEMRKLKDNNNKPYNYYYIKRLKDNYEKDTKK